MSGSGDRRHLGECNEEEKTMPGCLKGCFWSLFEKYVFVHFFVFECLENVGFVYNFSRVFNGKFRNTSVDAQKLKVVYIICYDLKDYQHAKKVGLRSM